MTSVFTMQVKHGNVRLTKRDVRGGGPLYDLGVYCINTARTMFASEPVEVFGFAASSKDQRFRQCREMVSATMRFPGERLAGFTCSFGAAPTATYRVVGTKGDVCVDAAYEIAEEMTEETTVDEKSKKKTFAKRDQFAPELLYFSDCVRRGVEPEPSGREGLADVRVIRAILRSIDERRPVRLPVMERRRRPSMRQEMRRMPVEVPEMVGAVNPSRD